LADFQKILKYKISLKSIQWEPSWIKWTDGWADRHTWRQTDMMKTIITFCNFVNVPTKVKTVQFEITSCFMWHHKEINCSTQKIFII